MTYHDRLIVLILFLCLTVTAAFAETDVAVGGIRMERQGSVPALPGDVEDSLEAKVPPPATDGKSDAKDEEKEENDKKGGIETIIAPIPSRSPLLGWTLSVPMMLIFHQFVVGLSGVSAHRRVVQKPACDQNHGELGGGDAGEPMIGLPTDHCIGNRAHLLGMGQKRPAPKSH